MAHLARVKARLSIHAHRKVRGLLEGEYAAIQVGRGIDFNDLREYVRGDDVKDIDWKASARTRMLLVRRYVAERKHTVVLAVSTGRSMAAMNDARHSKRDLAVFVAGVMGYLAVRHGDLVALVHGDARRQHVRPPDSGELYLERLLGRVHDAITPTAPPSDLTAVLDYVARAIRRRTILVVVSDETHVSDELADSLRRLTAQHEVLFLTIGDLDPTITAGAPRRLVDVDVGAEVPSWLRGDARLQEEYAALVAGEESQLRRRLDQLGVVHERVRDTESAITAVFRALERHRHARRR
ncbi:DUF58 domain-containing protein [Nocardioides bizhenqiangii]|uniref:DUF58 domain-containing protein n=1 Tax=Nocardioides bizhenqiangii TaxID=3095076 RepID=A0ABZ0ZTN1_9ACTN|nr:MULTISPECIES: DUF58 domain-containing protein [unclassified Nocardioides]MDZ5621897.1 DUF58 domain-containing protein [Nocardioides sp. HM23]WQQ27420.1 DUF58 domain-containing protein [Nocardioides sp. HM61]